MISFSSILIVKEVYFLNCVFSWIWIHVRIRNFTKTFFLFELLTLIFNQRLKQNQSDEYFSPCLSRLHLNKTPPGWSFGDQMSRDFVEVYNNMSKTTTAIYLPLHTKIQAKAFQQRKSFITYNTLPCQQLQNLIQICSWIHHPIRFHAPLRATGNSACRGGEHCHRSVFAAENS